MEVSGLYIYISCYASSNIHQVDSWSHVEFFVMSTSNGNTAPPAKLPACVQLPLESWNCHRHPGILEPKNHQVHMQGNNNNNNKTNTTTTTTTNYT